MNPILPRWLRIGLGLVVVATLTVACGSDDDADDTTATDAADGSASTEPPPSTGSTAPTSTDTTSGEDGSGQTSSNEGPADGAGTTAGTTGPTRGSSTTSTSGRDRGLVDVRPVPIDSVEVLGPTTLELTVEGEVEPCFVIDRVDIVETADAVELTVHAGSEPGAVCIQIVELHTVVAELAQPLGDRALIDGSTGATI